MSLWEIITPLFICFRFFRKKGCIPACVLFIFLPERVYMLHATFSLRGATTTISPASRCILVLFERYGCPKKCVQKVLATFLLYIHIHTYIYIYIYRYILHVKTKWNIVYSPRILKTKYLFKRHKYLSANALNIKYIWTLSYNHWGFLSITKLFKT